MLQCSAEQTQRQSSGVDTRLVLEPAVVSVAMTLVQHDDGAESGARDADSTLSTVSTCQDQVTVLSVAGSHCRAPQSAQGEND